MTTDGPASHGHRRRRAADLSLLAPGEHLYALHRDEGEQRRVTGTFVRCGLAAGDRVVVAVGSPARARDVLEADGLVTEGAVRSGQLVFRDVDEMYRSWDAARDPAALGAALRDGARRTSADGFPGLRVAAEMDGFAAMLGSLDALLRWERTASVHQAEAGITTICQYDGRQLPGADAALIAAEHTAVAAYAGPRPLASFLAVADPWGLRVSGEVDLSNRWAFVRAVRARLAVRPRVHLDLSELAFLDVGSLRSLYQLAASLPDDGAIVLSHPTQAVARLLALCRFGGAPVEVEP